MRQAYLGFRSHTLGDVAGLASGTRVNVAGWVAAVRRQKSHDFIHLRDAFGTVQVVSVASQSVKLHEEDVISVSGITQAAARGGGVEVLAESVVVENAAKHPLPLSVKHEAEAQTPQQRDAGLKYRYLELRRPELQANLRLRAKVASAIRQFMSDEAGFLEVDTPTLFKSTPEGAKEFLVPVQSRATPPRFFALAQSPQQLKQLLMVAGVDRYFQFARCYRDEGGRADRQPEFSQMDMEMSFVRETRPIEAVIEGAVRAAWEATVGFSRAPPPLLPGPFPRMSLPHALERYGSDKPDAGFGMTIDDRGTVRCPGLAKLTSRSEKDLVRGPARADVVGDDLVLRSPSRADLGAARLRAAAMMRSKNLPLPPGELPPHQPFWVHDFGLFEVAEDHPAGNALASVHHPFTAAVPQDEALLQAALESGDRAALLKVRGNHVDLVCGGVELGGGSVRIHDPATQRRVLVDVLGLSKEACEAKFGHLLHALEVGAPPHGGFAIGFDRFMAQLCGAASLNKVMAFPKSSVGTDPMTGAPCEVEDEALATVALRPRV